jgi:5-hydroxyisourate hydrolase
VSSISTHVLDTSIGKPAAGVPVALDQEHDGQWKRIGAGETDLDGRLRSLVPAGAPLSSGVYCLQFDVERYFNARRIQTFYPAVTVIFEISSTGEHYHVPLLLSPFGYSTYRGS